VIAALRANSDALLGVTSGWQGADISK